MNACHTTVRVRVRVALYECLPHHGWTLLVQF